MSEPLVGIVVGSESDRERMQPALDELEARGIAHEFEVRSAHRQPDSVAEYGRTARERGLRVLIAGAGLAAALPGVRAVTPDREVRVQATTAAVGDQIRSVYPKVVRADDAWRNGVTG